MAALFARIRLGLKHLLEPNTLAYFAEAMMTQQKSFIKLGLERGVPLLSRLLNAEMYKDQGTLTGGEGSVQLTSLY